MATIRVLDGPTAEQTFEVEDGAVLGRESDADVLIPARGVSRQHARFTFAQGGEVWLEDLETTNGTFVNGQRITRHKLTDGDTIKVVGVSLRFTASAPAPARATGRPSERLPGSGPTGRPVARSGRQPPASASRLQLAEDAAAAPQEAYSADATAAFATPIAGVVAAEVKVRALERRLEVLSEVAQALGSIHEKDKLLAAIFDRLFAAFPQANRGFMALGPSVEQLEVALVREVRDPKGTAKLDGAAAPPKVSRTIARRVFEEKRAILSHDAGGDERFAGAQSIMSMALSAVMVAPLLHRGQVGGFIQLASRKQFAPEDVNLLVGLASSAAVFLKNLELFEAAAREERERTSLQAELQLASRIQAALLPKAAPDLPWLELAGHTRAARQVGGDYYDYLLGPKGECYVVIGDVSGKGMGAGLVMVMARAILHSLVRTAAPAPKALAIEANRLLRRDIKPGMFLSLLIGRCDAERRTIRFAGCGHERPLVLRAATGQVETVELAGTVLGVVADNSQHVSEVEVRLAKDDVVLLFTDGATEAMDGKKQQFGATRLAQAVAASGKKPPRELVQSVMTALDGHATGVPQHDDITLVAMRCR